MNKLSLFRRAHHSITEDLGDLNEYVQNHYQ